MLELSMSVPLWSRALWVGGFALLVAAVAYFMGCFNGAVIVSKYILHDDVRNHGSGNAGLTNFFRTFGGGLTLVVILCDVLKAVVAVVFGTFIAGRFFVPLLGEGIFRFLPDSPTLMLAWAKYWTAMWCLLGHMFPCMFRFKGGKGILSGGTIAFMLDWHVALVVWGGFIILVLLTRYVSLGSCWAGASFPFVTWFVYQDAALLVLSIVTGGLILWKHRGNIQRLLAGTESKFSLHKKH